MCVKKEYLTSAFLSLKSRDTYKFHFNLLEKASPMRKCSLTLLLSWSTPHSLEIFHTLLWRPF